MTSSLSLFAFLAKELGKERRDFWITQVSADGHHRGQVFTSPLPGSCRLCSFAWKTGEKSERWGKQEQRECFNYWETSWKNPESSTIQTAYCLETEHLAARLIRKQGWKQWRWNTLSRSKVFSRNGSVCICGHGYRNPSVAASDGFTTTLFFFYGFTTTRWR